MKKIKINLKQSDALLSKSLARLFPIDIAEIISNYDLDEQIRVFHLLDKNTQVLVFSYIDHNAASFELLFGLEKETSEYILNHLDSDDLTNFIQSIEEEDDNKEKVLSLLTTKRKNTVLNLLGYPREAVASFINNRFLTVKVVDTIKVAMNKITSESDNEMFVDTIFAVDNNGEYVGTISLQDLITARSEDDLASIVENRDVYLLLSDSLDDAILKYRNYDLNCLPVLDEYHKVQGILTTDDVFDLIEDDISHDIHNFALIDEADQELGPLSRSLKRIPWLLVSVVLNLLIASLLTVFDKTIESIAALALFQPMILGMSGNIGTQSLASTIIIYHNEPKFKVGKHILSETLISIFNSVASGVIGFIFALLVISITNIGTQSALSVAFTIGLSLLIAMAVSSFFSIVVPLLFIKLKLDPGIASGPTITTISDLSALVIYFVVATLLLL
jgi:magnesium transporter